jgi:F5/8 type C domain/Transglycosylase SLT domain
LNDLSRGIVQTFVRILPVLGRPRGASRARGMAIAVVALALAGVCAALATDGIDRAGAQEANAAVPVPPAYLPTLISAAASCPSLSPPRLAGQIMATSAFDPNAASANGGQGLAGLTAATWKKWVPSPTAQRSNPSDNIVALAHDMCDLVGQLRAAAVTGDGWWAALAAFHSGIASVVAAGGVPAAASGYVDRVIGYANWYAGRPEFVEPTRPAAPSPTSPSVRPSPTATAASIAPTPDAAKPATTVPPAPTTTGVPAPPPDLAAGRPMTSSGFTDVYPEKNANDGDPDTYWESSNNAFPQWLQVDLGQASQVSRFLLQVPPLPLWLQRTQTIQITGSMDGSNYFVIVGPAGYSFDPVNANAVQVRFTPTTARYLRLTFTANTDWPAGQLSQWQVYAS